jgi:hypothetical protein
VSGFGASAASFGNILLSVAWFPVFREGGHPNVFADLPKNAAAGTILMNGS